MATSYAWEDKDPRDKADYLVEWDQTVNDKDPLLGEDEKIATSTWSVARKDGEDETVGSEVVLEADEIVLENIPLEIPDKKWTRLWISGGEAGVVYIFTNEITTDLATPNRWNRKIYLKVRDL